MNELYFGCTDCKHYIDAGYRWAHWALEHKGIVNTSSPVSAGAVLAERDYWNPDEDASGWLKRDVLPHVRAFMEEHLGHNLIFGDAFRLFKEDYAGEYLDWLQTGFDPDLSPRYLAERLGLRSWVQVKAYIASIPYAPWWWGENSMMMIVEKRFKSLASANRA